MDFMLGIFMQNTLMFFFPIFINSQFQVTVNDQLSHFVAVIIICVNLKLTDHRCPTAKGITFTINFCIKVML